MVRLTAEDFRLVYETNLFAVVDVIHACLPLLLKTPAGRIVNVTSLRGSLGNAGAWVGQPFMAYSSSKTALNAITAHCAFDLRDTTIRISGAAPGNVATGFAGRACRKRAPRSPFAWQRRKASAPRARSMKITGSCLGDAACL